jgi:TonB family protein
MTRLKHLLLCSVIMSGILSASDQSGRKSVFELRPEYPDVAAKMNLHGTVRIKLWISPDGSVRRTEYVGGHPLLAESALKAVKSWRYEPDTKESTSIVEIRF